MVRGDRVPLKATTIGPPGKRWRADVGLTLNAGLVAL